MPNYLIVQSGLNAHLLKEGINNYGSTDLTNSDRFREEGNLKFKEGKYFAAIAQYNKALICGRNDKVRSSLCYANRSAVYLELKYFKHCLHNIDLAEENYPPEKIQKLHQRREKCLKMMENLKDEAVAAFTHKFKLSYEPNPKLPFFIDSLKLKEDSKTGKHLVSTRDLKAGDVIAVMDHPWRTSINSLVDNYVQGCYNCHDANNGDLIPGDCKTLFCSEACKSNHEHQNSNHEEFNELENIYSNRIRLPSIVKFFMHMHNVFGSVDEMKKFVDEHRNKQYTVFDFDWSDPNDPMYYKNMLLTILNTTREPKNDGQNLRLLRDVCSSFLKPDSQIARILNDNKKNGKFLDEIFHAINNNRTNFSLTACDDFRYKIARFFHPSMHLLVPTCEANVIIHTNRKDLIWTALKPISAGTPLMGTMFYKDGKSWCFKCSSGKDLVSCKKNLSSMEGEIVVDDHAKKNLLDFFMHNDPKNVENWLEYLKSCCDFINENIHGYDKDPKMKLAIKAKMMVIKRILVFIENPFPPSNYYLNMDILCKSKYQRSTEIEFETEDV